MRASSDIDTEDPSLNFFYAPFKHAPLLSSPPPFRQLSHHQLLATSMVDKRGLLSAEAVEDGNGYASFPPSSGTAPPLASPSTAQGSGGKRGCRDPLFLAAFILNLGTCTDLCALRAGGRGK